MGIQMSIPFTVLQNGAVSVESDPAVQVQQRVEAIVSTEIGQRAMRAAMGLPLSKLLFGTDNIMLAAELSNMVTQQLNWYEPGIQVISVNPVTGQQKDGIASIDVKYSPILSASQASAVANVVTIQVGGTVTEVTSVGNR